MSNLFDDDELTEFDWLDPTRVDLVGAPANKFAPLVAKSEPERDPIRDAEVRRTMKHEKKVEKMMRRMGYGDPFVELAADFEVAKATHDRRGTRSTLAAMQRAGQRLTTAKLMAQENARDADPRTLYRRLHGQGEPLFTNSQPFSTPAVRDVR